MKFHEWKGKLLSMLKELKVLWHLRRISFSENSKSFAFQDLKELRSLQKTEVIEVF